MVLLTSFVGFEVLLRTPSLIEIWPSYLPEINLNLLFYVSNVSKSPNTILLERVFYDLLLVMNLFSRNWFEDSIELIFPLCLFENAKYRFLTLIYDSIFILLKRLSWSFYVDYKELCAYYSSLAFSSTSLDWSVFSLLKVK